MIHQQPVDSRINHGKHHHGSKNGYLGHGIKEQIIHIAFFHAYGQKCGKLNDKYEGTLQVVIFFPACFRAEYPKKRKHCIKYHEQSDYVFGVNNDVLFHALLFGSFFKVSGGKFPVHLPVDKL